MNGTLITYSNLFHKTYVDTCMLEPRSGGCIVYISHMLDLLFLWLLKVSGKGHFKSLTLLFQDAFEDYFLNCTSTTYTNLFLDYYYL